MKVNIQSVNFNVDKKLVDFIQNKIIHLDRFYDKIVNTDIYLKVQQTSEKENKLVEIKVNIPGNDIVVKKEAKTFEEAVNMSLDSIKRQLTKKKEKIREKN